MKSEEASSENVEHTAAADKGVITAQKDMSKVSLMVALLAVLLLVIFFFGMNRNIAGLTTEVKSLGLLRDEVSSLDKRLVDLQTDMPVQMQRMIAQDVVNEMAMKATYLSTSLPDEALRAKMQEVLKGLKEVRTGLEK
ncbi:hypothetical protein [Pseudodesulfovibrio sp.]|uniref:hypothetical protein n=1 Tax=unclassified Pseudodesulfovibrio TaxID=2661612 RepID=UPI003B007B12